VEDFHGLKIGEIFKISHFKYFLKRFCCHRRNEGTNKKLELGVYYFFQSRKMPRKYNRKHTLDCRHGAWCLETFQTLYKKLLVINKN
jgi:hypothetical protein